MARFIVLLLITFAAIAGLTMYRMDDVGYLTAGIGSFSLDTTLLIAGAALLAGIVALLILFKIFSLIHKIFLYFGAQRKTRLIEKARTSLSQGLIELAEGRFEEAEKLLLKQVKHSDNALLSYLSAARAAQYQGEHERRDDYLRKAHDSTPTAEIAIGLTKAELQLDHEQYEQALANLNHLHDLSPKHAYVIKLLVKTYRHLADWKNIQNLLNDIKYFRLYPGDKITRIELEAWQGLLSEQSQTKELSNVINIWESIPANLKLNTQLVEHYAHLLIELDESEQAEQVLRNYLQSHWNESSIVLYSELDVAINNHHLEQVESWLQDHQHNAHLLLALGKLCLNNKLWGKAQHYLEASLATLAMPETYLKLAQLLEQHMDEAEQAQKYYQMGLECLVGKRHHIHEEVSESSQADENKPALKIVQSD